MQQRNLTIAVLASAAFFALSTAAGSQVIVSGNDEKVLWDDAGQAVFSAPGKDTISFIDIGETRSISTIPAPIISITATSRDNRARFSRSFRSCRLAAAAAEAAWSIQ